MSICKKVGTALMLPYEVCLYYCFHPIYKIHVSIIGIFCTNALRFCS